MDIVIHCMGMPFNGETVRKKSLGGSESAAYYQARELARRGHRVHVFTTSEEQGSWDGVNYLCVGNINQNTPLGEQFEYYARNTPHDVLIVQRHADAFHKQFASKVNIWQLHDLALYRQAMRIQHGLWQVDAVTCVSKWHKDQVTETYGIDDKFVFVVPNGVDADLYNETFEPETVKFLGTKLQGLEGKFLMLYSSRPERGFENLVKPGGIMDQLKGTNVHLLACAYANTVPQMAQYYNQLEQWARERGNVTMLGSLTKPQLAALQRTVDIAIYPTQFEEVSCITAMETMHAGLPLLTSAVGALPETCMDAGVEFVKLKKDGSVNIAAFVDAVKDFLTNDKKVARLSDAQCNAARRMTWSRAVDHLEATIEECFERKRGSLDAKVRHSIEHSDIGFARRLQSRSPLNSNPTAIALRSGIELDQLYDFSTSPEKYKAHYDLHQSKYYDSHEEQVIGEDVTRTSRYRATFAMLERFLRGKGASNDVRVLDYGCAHGHYLIPLAKNFKAWRFTGVDVSARAIGAALKWARRDNVTNVELRLGSQDVLNTETLCKSREEATKMELDGTTGEPIVYEGAPDLFDAIIAGEVVEHVPDWQALMDQFASILKPGGVIICTTPAGRWEWTGTEAFREAREHLHHFERQDIVDICGSNAVDILYAPAGHDKTGRPLGSWVWGVTPTSEFDDVDDARKEKLLAPRQTVSACLIVKDGEKTLRRCIDSCVDWVDEFIIAVDKNTKDRTREVIQHLIDDYPYKPFTVFDGEAALEVGFAAARNATIEKATGDWVLWLDADEEVQSPWELWKYLRPSHFQGYGFPQIHYSTSPPAVLTTDYPCRLFRRNGKIKFYGLVHEHPESEVGKGIEKSIMRHDVQFTHSGYVDEGVRRERFRRNLPLVFRDRKENPDRGLNRYMLLRDIAQMLMFELEQTQGIVVDGQLERAEEAVRIYEEMVEKDPVRTVIDALKYYSHCVAVAGRGFEAKISMAFKNDHAPDMNVNLDTEGRFHSKAFYAKFVTKLHEEATRLYESKYL